MEPFIRLTGIAAPLPIDNVDTDAIIPSRETQSVSRDGYGVKLFANWRYRPGSREEDADFVLNRPSFREARILVAGRNFGCGSSREAAVWSLWQFGIRCVIAESFGTIFRNNCVRNGLMPVSLPLEIVETLFREIADGRHGLCVTVDLEQCRVQLPSGLYTPFKIGKLEREMLLNGSDEVALTLTRREQIDSFRQRDRLLRPWIYQAGADPT